ncbi:hypothetical protein ACJJTC_017562 [Scirpophaga incertulas]
MDNIRRSRQKPQNSFERQDYTKAILVYFINKYAKEDFVAAARQKRLSPTDIGLPGSHRIYINDHLTSSNKQLLSKAKTLARENGFQFVWVKHAKIFVRKDSTSPFFTVAKEKDLLKISANSNFTEKDNLN